MADFRTMLTDPLTVLGASMMAGSDPNRTGLGGIGEALLGTGQYIHAQDQAAIEQQRYAEEQARARQMADLQMQLIRSKIAGAGPSYSKTPTYVKGPGGELGIVQLSDTGQPLLTPLPEGYEAVRQPTFLNIGSGYASVPYGEVAPTGPFVPMGISPEQQPGFRREVATAAAGGRIAGETRQQAIADLPGVAVTTGTALRQLNEIRNHPGLEASTGLSSLLPTLPGSDKADFEARMDQLAGGAFLQALQALQGTGQITEKEGEKAEQSIIRMRRAVSKDDFLDALADYERFIQDNVKELQKKAGQEPVGFTYEPTVAPSPASAPAVTPETAVPDIESLLEKYR